MTTTDGLKIVESCTVERPHRPHWWGPYDRVVWCQDRTPALVERVEDWFSQNHHLPPFEQRWMVEPPAKGTCYRVTRSEWFGDDYSVRVIWEWEGE